MCIRDRTVVELRVHQHDRDPRLGVPGQDGVVDRRRAAVAGQQRGVDVDDATRWDREDLGREDLSVSDHHHQLRVRPADLCDRLRRADPVGLVDVEAVLLRRLLDRGGHDLVPMPGPVGLGDHQRHLMARGDQRIERGHRKGRRAGENEAQRGGASSPRDQASTTAAATSSSSSSSSSSLRRVSRLVRRSMKRIPSRWSSSCW